MFHITTINFINWKPQPNLAFYKCSESTRTQKKYCLSQQKKQRKYCINTTNTNNNNSNTITVHYVLPWTTTSSSTTTVWQILKLGLIKVFFSSRVLNAIDQSKMSRYFHIYDPERISSTCVFPAFMHENALGQNSQNFLCKFFIFFVTLGLKILRLYWLYVVFEADINKS